MNDSTARSVAAAIAAITLLVIVAPRCVRSCDAFELRAHRCSVGDADSPKVMASMEPCAAITSFVLDAERPRSPIERALVHHGSRFRLDGETGSAVATLMPPPVVRSAPPGARVPLRV